MEVIRKEGNYELNAGSPIASRLFNVTDQAKDLTPAGTAKMRVSYWFGLREKERLQSLPKKEFKKECEKILSSL